MRGTGPLDSWPIRVATPSRRRWTTRPASRAPWLEPIALVILCALLFGFGLGDRGLAYSEGHRVGPAWEMLDAGSPATATDAWLIPHLFGTPYLRKPPGMFWAIASSSWLLGRAELASRLPSALAMTVLVLVSWRFTTRWLGHPWGLAAGAAQALFPIFWSSARSAEIEMVHASAAGCAALLLARTMLGEPRHRWLCALGSGVAVCVMALAKGPAALPLVAAIPVGACLARRSLLPLATPALALVLLIPGLALGLIALAIVGALDRNTEPVITQGVSEFLWDRSKLLRILTLPAVAWGSMLPGALALLLVPWREAADSASDPRPGRPDLLARALGLSWVLAIAAYTALGVSNPRYLLPCATLLPPLVAYGIAGLRRPADGDGFVGGRRGLARLLALFWPGVWPVILILGFAGFVVFYEGPRGRTSGDAPGAALGAILEPDAVGGATVWVDELVECRPEVLLYARTWTPALRIRWIKPLESAAVHAGDILIVRTDRHELAELERNERDRCASLVGGAAMIHSFNVHKYSFEVYRLPLTPDSQGGEPGAGGASPQP